MSEKSRGVHFTVRGTKTLAPASCYLHQYVINCSAAGTGPWTLKIQDRGGTPKILVSAFNLSVPTNGLPLVSKFFDKPIPMDTGIDAVVAGGADDGVAEVYVNFTDG